MAGAGSGGNVQSVGYRYSRLSCAPALAMHSARPNSEVCVGRFRGADLCTATAHLVKAMLSLSLVACLILPCCSAACVHD